MANNDLAAYLNDHLAGSVTVIELLEHLEEAHAGSELGHTLAELRAEIAADRRELETLMDRLQISRSGPRQTAAWLAGKAAEIKLHWDDPAGGAFRLLESLDIVATGIEGKRGLWAALDDVAQKALWLRQADYGSLARRAEDQRKRLEGVRLDAARSALGAENGDA